MFHKRQHASGYQGRALARPVLARPSPSGLWNLKRQSDPASTPSAPSYGETRRGERRKRERTQERRGPGRARGGGGGEDTDGHDLLNGRRDTSLRARPRGAGVLWSLSISLLDVDRRMVRCISMDPRGEGLDVRVRRARGTLAGKERLCDAMTTCNAGVSMIEDQCALCGLSGNARIGGYGYRWTEGGASDALLRPVTPVYVVRWREVVWCDGARSRHSSEVYTDAARPTG